MDKWRLKRTVQCKLCPWKVSTNPHDIPRGYDVAKHKALAATIAREGDLSHRHVMACHEGEEEYCIGWLVNQLGPGNNIPMRLRMMDCENAHEIRTIGPQHERFEDTLPRRRLKTDGGQT